MCLLNSKVATREEEGVHTLFCHEISSITEIIACLYIVKMVPIGQIIE